MDKDIFFLFPPFWLDVRNEQLWRGAQTLVLRPKTFAVLRYLIAQAGQLITQDELLDAVWGPTAVSEAVVRSSIRELRSILDDRAQYPQFIQTVHRRGYRFIVPVTVADTPPPLGSLITEVSRRTPPSAPTAPEAAAPPPEPSLSEEYKVVSILCCAMKDASVLAVHHGPEATHRLMQAFFAVAHEVIQRYDGTITHITAEGFTAVFGAPVGQEDHARRAVLAALDLGQHLCDQSLGAAHAAGMGLHTGPVVVGHPASASQRLYTAVGATVHQALWLQRLAPPGTILLSAATHELVQTEAQVNVADVPAGDGQGLPGPVYMLQGLMQRRAGVSGQGTRHRSRFVGRERELALLHERLAHVAQGHGQVIGVTGEPGIGKSRLLAEFHRSLAGQPVTYREGHCLPYSSMTPYVPVCDLLRQGCGSTEADGAAVITTQVCRYLEDTQLSSEEDAPLLLHLLDVPVDGEGLARFSPQERKARTFALLRHLVLHDSQRQPLVLAVENLHWVDATSEEWFTALVEHLASTAILLLVTHRPGYRPPWLEQSVATQMALPRLLPEDSRTIVQAVLQTTPLAEHVLRIIVAKAAGNPFFLEELAWAMLEQRSSPVVPGIPDTIQAVLAARIDRLPPEEKRLLQTAAVMGPEVPIALLQALGELSEETLQQGLRHLQTAEFLYETSLFPERVYTFKHALTHEVAYGGLLQERRRVLHARIAQALLERFPETAETRPELLAHHYTAAGVHDQAIQYWERAGQRANERSAYVEAIDHFTKGLEMLHTLLDIPERAQYELQLQLALGDALTATRGYAVPEVGHAYTRAWTLCQQLPETPQRFVALFNLWRFYNIRAELQIDRELAEQLVTLAQRQRDPLHLMQAHFALGETLFRLGHLAAAYDHLTQSLTMATRHLSHAWSNAEVIGTRVACLLYTGWVLWHLGYAHQGWSSAQEALTLMHELSHPFTLAFAQAQALILQQFHRNYEVVYERAEALLALSVERAFPFWLAYGTILRGWTLAMQGHTTEGIAQMRQGLATWQHTGAELERSYWLALLAEGYGKGGQVEAGLQTLDECFASVAKTGECWWEAELHRLKGELLLLQSRGSALQSAISSQTAGSHTLDAKAETSFHQALTLAHRREARALELRAASSLSRLWQRQGKRREARALLAPIYGWFTEGFDTADLREAKALLDELS